ncbi:capsular biosynthesis protein, partial [Vibrio parahaemolyticus]
ITLFEHSVLSFKNYFERESFLFIIRDKYDTKKFISEKIKKLGIKYFDIICLEKETRGQAETVFLGLKNIDDNESLTIFNIDTFRPNFIYPDLESKGDGYLEVFKGSGDNWSFALPVDKNTTLIRETAEKRPISNLCSTGLYHFDKVSDYKFAYLNYQEKPECEWEKGEIYVAPLYNYLISSGKKIHYHLIKRDEVIFCGTPEEYNDLLGM